MRRTSGRRRRCRFDRTRKSFFPSCKRNNTRERRMEAAMGTRRVMVKNEPRAPVPPGAIRRRRLVWISASWRLKSRRRGRSGSRRTRIRKRPPRSNRVEEAAIGTPVVPVRALRRSKRWSSWAITPKPSPTRRRPPPSLRCSPWRPIRCRTTCSRTYARIISVFHPLPWQACSRRPDCFLCIT